MKIWTNNEFEGHWPVGSTAVVVAKNAQNAAEYLTSALIARGLKGAEEKDMKEVILGEGNVIILCDGDY